MDPARLETWACVVNGTKAGIYCLDWAYEMAFLYIPSYIHAQSWPRFAWKRLRSRHHHNCREGACRQATESRSELKVTAKPGLFNVRCVAATLDIRVSDTSKAGQVPAAIVSLGHISLNAYSIVCYPYDNKIRKRPLPLSGCPGFLTWFFPAHF